MASTEVGSIHYALDLDKGKFDKGIDQASSKVKSFASNLGDKMATASRNFTIALGVMAAGAVVFGKRSVDAYNESIEAQTKLRTNLLNVKGATEEHVQALLKQASALQAVGVIEDDAIVAGQSQLATFNLQAKTIETLTPKITDMVAQLKGHNATAEDMVTINNLVGKVMTGNIGALSRYGVTLSDAQAKQLESNDETKKAATLVEVLSQNYGKVNEALRNTPEGRITALKNSYDDFQELIGGSITMVIDPLIKAFDKWLQSIGGVDGAFEKLNGVMDKLKDNIPMIATAITVALLPTMYKLAASVLAATWPIALLLAAGLAIGYVVQQIVNHFGGWNAVLQMMMPLWNQMQVIWNDYIYPAILLLKEAFLAMWEVVQAQLIPAWNALMAAIEPLMPSLKFLAAVIGVLIVGAILVLITALTGVISFLTKLFTGVVQVVSGIIQQFQGWITLLARAQL